MKFKLNDTIIVKENSNFCGKTFYNGYIGKIKYIDEYYYGIEWNEYISGHAGCWEGKRGHCWSCDVPAVEENCKLYDTRLEFDFGE